MKKFYYICIGAAALLSGLFVASCDKDPMVELKLHDAADAFLSVEEAQRFFEDSFAYVQTRSNDKKGEGFLDPGDYTPQWESAATSQNDALGSVDVPLLTEYKYRAIRSEFKNGKVRYFNFDSPMLLGTPLPSCFYLFFH